MQEERVVGNDSAVRYDGRVLQIPEARHRRHFAKAKARACEYWDGSLALFHGPRKIASCTGDGALVDESQAQDKSDKSAA